MPNTPKPDGHSRRTRRTAQFAYLAAGPSGITPPPLPPKNRRGPWTNDARSAWMEWWASPMAHAWIEADKVSLRRAIRLVDDLAAGRSENHGALTALEDRLGLTPKARRTLAWEIDRAGSIAPPAPPSSGDDPRLRAVK
jgi:hypothetical protein